MSLRSLVVRIVPASVIRRYHYVLAILGDLLYGRPSLSLVVIGVTGTKGKTTTCVLLTEILHAAGKKTAMITTAELRIGEAREQNMYKQTMLGRLKAQKFLRRALRAGCTHAVVETSSLGVLQHRHHRIRYDVAAFTNLTPEHIEAHGGFEEYKRAKLKFFDDVAHLPKKSIDGRVVPRAFFVNADDEHASSFLGKARGADGAIVAAFGKGVERTGASRLHAITHIELYKEGMKFALDGIPFSIALTGVHNAYNAACAASIAEVLGVPLEESANALSRVQMRLGRMEYIHAGQPFSVIVDYAHEPASYAEALSTARALTAKKSRVLVLIGSAGGGRDRARQPLLGRIAARFADLIVVANEDPYDDDPQVIIENVVRGAIKGGKVRNESVVVISDRREAIAFLFSKATSGDTVMLLGKGCEPWIMEADNKKTPWDERRVAREELGRLGFHEREESLTDHAS